MKYFPVPTNGDIDWYLFPESQRVLDPKPRSTLIIEIVADIRNKPIVTVFHGTTKKLDRLYPSEFKIEKKDGASFNLSGLAANIKFDFNHRIKLPFCSTWFGASPGQAYVNRAKPGVLAPKLVARAKQIFDNSN